MANDAVPGPPSHAIDHHDLERHLETRVVEATSDRDGFFAQVSSNPFFTAVSLTAICLKS